MAKSLMPLVAWLAASAAAMIGLVFGFRIVGPALHDEYLRWRYGYGEMDVQQYHKAGNR
jgi:hypothetical protein